MDKLIKTIDEYVKKAPALPANIKELLVQFAPWGALLSIALSIPTILSIFGVGAYLGAYRFMYAHVGPRYMIVTAFLLANLILRGLSIQGLFARSIKGWTFFFYSILLYAVYSLINYDIIGGLISTLISLYLAFQVKEYYK